MSCVTFGNEYQSKSFICDDFIICFRTINLFLIIIINNLLVIINNPLVIINNFLVIINNFLMIINNFLVIINNFLMMIQEYDLRFMYAPIPDFFSMI